MKSSPPEPGLSQKTSVMGSTTRPGLLGRIRHFLRQFKQDIRTPLPGPTGKPLWARIRARVGYLYRKYGWKLVAGVVAYYLVRDTLLYIILPYLIAKRLIE